MWSKKLENLLKNVKSQLTAIHDLGYVSVTVQLEEKYPQIPITKTWDFVEKALETLSVTYGEWMSKMSGRFGYPNVLDSSGKIPIKLYGISLRNDRRYPETPKASKYGAKWKKLIYTGTEFDTSPDGKKSNWFNNEYDKRVPPQSLFLSFTSKIAAAGHAQPEYLRLQLSDEKTTFTSVENIDKAKSLFLHEIGHSFWMDDMADIIKYPKPSSTYNLFPNDTNMFGNPGLTDMDHLMIRINWMHSHVAKSIFG
jgi:hypothetical protein